MPCLVTGCVCFRGLPRFHPDTILERAAFAFSDWMSALGHQAPTGGREASFDDQLDGITFPGAAGTAADALIQADKKRIKLIGLQA